MIDKALWGLDKVVFVVWIVLFLRCRPEGMQ